MKKRLKYLDFCHRCRKSMGTDDQIVYVEQEANRFFCSEKCIREYYDPVADYYKSQHLTARDPHDIPEADFIKYESYAPLCLSNPDEIWMEENENGESYYYFLANFTDQGGRFSYIVMCFCLELEPTYLILSFPTRDRKMVEAFRRGKQLERKKEEDDLSSTSETELNEVLQDTFLAKQGNAIEEEMLRYRSKEDIPSKEFEDYAHLLEETIENPDEVWELQDEKNNTLLTLIRQQEENLHYVVVCTQSMEVAEGGGQENWKVIYSFPTNDSQLVQRYRRGALREGSAGTASFLH